MLLKRYRFTVLVLNLADYGSSQSCGHVDDDSITVDETTQRVSTSKFRNAVDKQYIVYLGKESTHSRDQT